MFRKLKTNWGKCDFWFKNHVVFTEGLFLQGMRKIIFCLMTQERKTGCNEETLSPLPPKDQAPHQLVTYTQTIAIETTAFVSCLPSQTQTAELIFSFNVDIQSREQLWMYKQLNTNNVHLSNEVAEISQGWLRPVIHVFHLANKSYVCLRRKDWTFFRLKSWKRKCEQLEWFGILCPLTLTILGLLGIKVCVDLLGYWQVKSCIIIIWMEPWLKWNTLFELNSTVVLSDGYNLAGKLNQ